MNLDYIINKYFSSVSDNNSKDNLSCCYITDVVNKTEGISIFISKGYGIKSNIKIFDENYELGTIFLNYINLDISELEKTKEDLLNIKLDNDITFRKFRKIFSDGVPHGDDIVKKLNTRKLEHLLDSSEEIIDCIYTSIYAVSQKLITLHPCFIDETTYLIDYKKNKLNRIYTIYRLYQDIFYLIYEIDQHIKNIIQYRKAAEFILSMNNTCKDLVNLPFYKRLYFYNLTTDMTQNVIIDMANKTRIDFLVSETPNIPDSILHSDISKVIECYANTDIQSIEYMYLNMRDVCNGTIRHMTQLNKGIKLCGNCNKYFFVKGNYDSNYCDRIFNGTTKTCQQLMSSMNYKSKVNSNPILKEYQKAYKRMYARNTNQKISDNEFRTWVDSASKQRNIYSEKYINKPSEKLINDFKEYLGNR